MSEPFRSILPLLRKTSTSVGRFAMAALTVLAGTSLAACGESCPKGQHEVLIYEQPIIITVGKTTTVTMVPVYECQR